MRVRRRSFVPVLATITLLLAVGSNDARAPLAAGTDAAAVRASGEGSDHARGSEEGIEELQEQAETSDLRHEALAEARAAGPVGITGPLRSKPAPGWAGEIAMSATQDDWEPAIAADPTAPFVYVLHNRYGGTPACRKNCPDPVMILNVSKDDGKTFGKDRFLCRCRNVKGQYDPLIEVVPQTGAVYAVWMNDYRISFSTSTDHGRTWSKPVPVHPAVNWGDKPILTSSGDGQDVYVSFNGPTHGDPWIAVSHDAGATWTAVRVTEGPRYYFEYGGAVLPDGTVVFSDISFSYTGPKDTAEGPILIHVLRSTDGGTTWTDTVIDRLRLGSRCRSRGCYDDFYDSGPALAKDPSGDLVVVYNGADKTHGPRTVYARSSTDGGFTWSDRVRVSRRNVNAAFPAAVSSADDEVRIWFMDQRTGRWNVRYRTSNDLGVTWSKAVRISDARSGAAYKNRKGFLEAYGDYGEIAVTSRGKTVAVWGEGLSYAGPGGIWLNRES